MKSLRRYTHKRWLMPIVSLVLLSLLAPACSREEVTELTDQSPLLKRNFSYLALGDSYTIGTAIGLDKAYAGQLRDSINHRTEIDSVHLEIIAGGGWTTANLISLMTNAAPDSSYDMVSLLIGVNNQFQKRPLTEYRKQFRELLEWSLALAGYDTSKVFVFSIPDWGVTPAGQGNAMAIAAEIDQFNLINKQISDSLKVNYYNITPLSRTAASNPGLVANDGLHFSSAMHTLWLKEYYDDILAQAGL